MENCFCLFVWDSGFELELSRFPPIQKTNSVFISCCVPVCKVKTVGGLKNNNNEGFYYELLLLFLILVSA